MKGITVKFKNKPLENGTLSTFEIEDCLVAQNGSPAAVRPQITIHLPKDDTHDVEGAWVEYEGQMFHVVGSTVPSIKENTPTRWNRYAIAEKIA